MTRRLIDDVADYCHREGLLVTNDKVVIGVSGGPDSLCLLHLLKTLASNLDLTLTIAHFNHQIRAESAQADEDFIREIAEQWSLPIFIDTKNIPDLARKHKQSLEEAGRHARYLFLWQVAENVNANKIAVGHNADDQAETVLMHFLRGSGLNGLRGMEPIIEIDRLQLRPLVHLTKPVQSSPKLIRPLLETSRSAIETYCQHHKLFPRQDVSNSDPTFLRNRLRHELIPHLETYNPNIRQTLQRTAKIVAAEVAHLEAHVQRAWDAVVESHSAQKTVFNRERWSGLALALKRSLLRSAIQTLSEKSIDTQFDHIEAAINILATGKTGAIAPLPQQLKLIVGYDTFTLAKQGSSSDSDTLDRPQLLTDEVLPVAIPGVTTLPKTMWQLDTKILDKRMLSAAQIQQHHRWEAYLDAEILGEQVVLRTRRPGDTFFPLGLSGHRKKIKSFMIDEKIPGEHRPYIPLLVSDNQISWVCGYRIDERAKLSTTTQQVLHLQFKAVS